MNASTSSLHLESANDRVPGQSQSVEVAFGLNVAHNLTQIMLGGVIVSALLIPNMVIITGSYSQHILLCTLGVSCLSIIINIQFKNFITLFKEFFGVTVITNTKLALKLLLLYLNKHCLYRTSRICHIIGAWSQ